MRKLLLVAFAAGAMGVAALPSTSLASSTSRSARAAVVHTCPPGNHDAQYCERCPDNEAVMKSTANAAATSALAAAQSLPGNAKSISFTFTPTGCGSLSFRLAFGVPHSGHLTFISVAFSVGTTKAGVPVTVTAPISTFGQVTLARYDASHDNLNVEVVATETSHTHSATKTLLGKDSF